MWVAGGIALLVTVLLGITQAPSRDETHTIAHLDVGAPAPPEAGGTSFEDRTPPAYYAVARTVARVGEPTLPWIRATSMLGWAWAALLLASIGRERGWSTAGVLTAGLAMSASGLLSQGMVARPYGLVAACLAGAIWVWHRSLRMPRAYHAVILAGLLLVAVALHFAMVAVVPCLLAAEWVAHRDDPDRSWGFAVASLVGTVPVLVSAVDIRRSITAVDRYPHQVDVTSLPGFYLSVLLPAVPGILVVAVVAGWTWRRRRHASSQAGAARVPAPLQARDPFATLVVALSVFVPAQVVVITALTSGAYLHRYALGGLVGLALLLGAAVDAVATRHLVPSALVPILLAACVGLAGARALDEQPSRSQVRALPAELGLSSATLPIGVADSYLFDLLRSETPRAIAGRIELVGPTTVLGDLPIADIYQPTSRGRLRGLRFLVIDTADLAPVLRTAHLQVVRIAGRARFSYGTTARPLIAVVVRPVAVP